MDVFWVVVYMLSASKGQEFCGFNVFEWVRITGSDILEKKLIQ